MHCIKWFSDCPLSIIGVGGAFSESGFGSKVAENQ